MFGHEARAILAQLATLNAKVDLIMATEADVQTALASLSTKEDVALALLKTEAASIVSLQSQVLALQTAAGTGAPVDFQPLLDQIATMSANTDAALASVQPAPAAGAGVAAGA